MLRLSTLWASAIAAMLAVGDCPGRGNKRLLFSEGEGSKGV